MKQNELVKMFAKSFFCMYTETNLKRTIAQKKTLGGLELDYEKYSVWIGTEETEYIRFMTDYGFTEEEVRNTLHILRSEGFIEFDNVMNPDIEKQIRTDYYLCDADILKRLCTSAKKWYEENKEEIDEAVNCYEKRLEEHCIKIAR